MATRWRIIPLTLCAAVLVLVVPACSGGSSGHGSPAASAAGFPLTLTDDDGVSVTLHSLPKRIVTFAPSDTEILFALGAGDRVVGVSGKADDYPTAALHERPNLDQKGGENDAVPCGPEPMAHSGPARRRDPVSGAGAPAASSSPPADPPRAGPLDHSDR